MPHVIFISAHSHLFYAEKSDMGDLFAEKIEVRPQVRQLLDKYGTISIDQLTKEIDVVIGVDNFKKFQNNVRW